MIDVSVKFVLVRGETGDGRVPLAWVRLDAAVGEESCRNESLLLVFSLDPKPVLIVAIEQSHLLSW